MKVFSIIAKLFAVLATAVGAIVLLATYGEKIVAWCKKTMDSFIEIVDDEEEYFSHESEVFEKYVSCIVDACKSFGCAVADATHISKASRRKLFRALDARMKGRYDINIIYFDVPLGTCLKRNKLRDGRALVPEQAIYSMHNQLSAPEYNEHEAITEIWKIGGRLF